MIHEEPKNAGEGKVEDVDPNKTTEEPTIEELLAKPMQKVKDAARILGVNHKTVREMIARGQLEHRRFGRAIRIPTSAVRSLTM